MKVTDETVPEEDLEEAEDAAVVEKRPRRKLFYIEAGKRGTLAKIMIGSILALVLFSLVINSYVQLNEVYSQISAAESTLNDLQSENVRMQTQLEGQASIRNIKEYAEAWKRSCAQGISSVCPMRNAVLTPGFTSLTFWGIWNVFPTMQ